jgi:hypothetical protein
MAGGHNRSSRRTRSWPGDREKSHPLFGRRHLAIPEDLMEQTLDRSSRLRGLVKPYFGRPHDAGNDGFL